MLPRFRRSLALAAAPLLLACTAPVAAHPPAGAPAAQPAQPAPRMERPREIPSPRPLPRRPPAPPSLDEAKQRATDYYQSGRYEEEIRAVTERARAFLARRVARAEDERLAIILDIDETSLSNWPEIQGAGFGYNSHAFHAWVKEGMAIAIGPTLDLFNFARTQGVEVFFITGRRQAEAEVTERNLREAGFDGWAGAYFKPDPCASCPSGYREQDHYPPLYDQYAALYKNSRRRWIAEKGYTIVLSLGDQQSDLSGGFVEQTFKLPNPFYTVP